MASVVSYIQAYLVLLCFTLLGLTDVAFLTNRRRDPLPAKGLQLALLWWSGTKSTISHIPVPPPPFSPLIFQKNFILK